MITTQEYTKPVAEAFSDAQKALSAIGRVTNSDPIRHTLQGKTRYGLQGVKLQITITHSDAGSTVCASANSDDVWDAGGKSAVKRFHDALKSVDDPTYSPRKNGLTPLQTTAGVSAFLLILLGIMALIRWEPGLKIEGTTGNLRKEYAYHWQMDDAGRDIALSIWNTASKHREIDRVV